MIAPLAVAVALTAAAPRDVVVARIDGEPLSAALLLAREARFTSSGAKLGRDDVLQGLIDDVLFARAARARRLDRRPEHVAELESERRRLAYERLYAKEIATLEPGEAQLRDLYHQGGDTVHVLLATFLTREDALASVARLEKGGAFAEEARRSATPATKRSGGDLGVVTRAQLDPAVADVAFASPNGKPLGPVALQIGYAVVVATDKKVADESGFAARREALRTFAAGQLRAEARRHLESALRAKAGVQIDEAFLKSTGGRLQAKGDEAAHPVATVHGRVLRYGEVLPELSALVAGQEGHLSGPAVKAQVTWALVDRLLMEDEALRRGYGEPKEIGPALQEAEIWTLATDLANLLAAESGAPTPAEVEAYYREHPAEFRAAERRACGHLLLRTEREAQAARRRVTSGETFERVAADVSLDRESAPRGGAIGELSADEIQTIARNGDAALAGALREVKPNEPSAPVQSRAGWHVVRCGPPLAAAARPFVEVSAALAERLASERKQAAIARQRFAARQAARIEIDRANVAALAAAR